MRLLPRSLAGQVISVTVIATVLTQTLIMIGLLFFPLDEEYQDFEDRFHFQKIANTAAYLNQYHSSEHQRILETASDDETSYGISDAPLGKLSMDTAEEAELMAEYLSDFNVLVNSRTAYLGDLWWIMFGNASEVCDVSQDGSPVDADCPFEEISIQLESGNWMNVRTYSDFDLTIFLFPILFSVLTSLIGIGGSVTVMARRITRSLRGFSTAAENLGRGETVEPLTVSGPAELSRTADAFNQMQERLSRFIQDRTAMLAAINHDLRTPITSRLIRREFIEAGDLRENIIGIAEEMRVMVDSYLVFSREEATEEDPEPVNLVHMLLDLASDCPQVSIEPTAPVVTLCRPNSIKRAFRNLIDNGVKYGEQVHVSLHSYPEQIIIEFRAQGPGIPEAMYDEVFTPFTRLDTSRDVTEGNVGLGLSIVRSIVRKHGGDVVPFRTLQEFGMRIILPNVTVGLTK